MLAQVHCCKLCQAQASICKTSSCARKESPIYKSDHVHSGVGACECKRKHITFFTVCPVLLYGKLENEYIKRDSGVIRIAAHKDVTHNKLYNNTFKYYWHLTCRNASAETENLGLNMIVVYTALHQLLPAGRFNKYYSDFQM